MSSKPNVEINVVIGLFFAVVLPTLFTFGTIEIPRHLVAVDHNPSPLGYTWSLGLFLTPMVAVALWFILNPKPFFITKAFAITALALPLLGFALDFLLGTLFFTFNNRAATLGLWVGAFNWQNHAWLPNQLPVEEFVFYTTGVGAALFIYVWCDEYWLKAYNTLDYHQTGKSAHRQLIFHPRSLWIGFSLILAAWVYKKFGPLPDHEGFPGYFTFMIVAAMVPSMLLFPLVKSAINWRALSFTAFILLLISLLWEVTMGFPYQWWGYRREQMIGITIQPWFELPAEEPNLWLSVTYVTIIIYESLKIWLASGRSFRSSYLGV